MIRTRRAFIEAVMDQVAEAKERVVPLLMVEAPEAPWTAAGLRELASPRDSYDPVMREATDLLVTFELPFLEEEERLIAEGYSLARDMERFELMMVDFERRFWEARFAEYQHDPSRWRLPPKADYDLCEPHRLESATVRRVLRDHGATTFEDLAPRVGADRTCPACRTGVTRLLIHELRRAKEHAS